MASASCSCNCGVLFSILDLLTGILVALSGLLPIFTFFSVRGFIIAFFMTTFGVLIIIMALAWMPFVDTWFPFYTRSLLGKGLWFLFLGALVFVPPVGGLVFGFILSLIVLITAVTYMILHCVGQDVKTVPLLSLCGVNCSCNFCCGAEVNTIVLGVLDLLAGIFVFICGLFPFLFGLQGAVISFILGAFLLIFGIMIITMALAWVPFIDIWFPFYTRSYMGKGLFLLYLGALCYNNPAGTTLAMFILSLLVLITAITYLILHCVGNMPYPYPLLQACGVSCACSCCGGGASSGASSHGTSNPAAGMSVYKSTTTTTRTVRHV